MEGGFFWLSLNGKGCKGFAYFIRMAAGFKALIVEDANRVLDSSNPSVVRRGVGSGSGTSIGRSLPSKGASYASVLRSSVTPPAGSSYVVVVGKNQKEGKVLGETVTTVDCLSHMLTNVTQWRLAWVVVGILTGARGCRKSKGFCVLLEPSVGIYREHKCSDE